MVVAKIYDYKISVFEFNQELEKIKKKHNIEVPSKKIKLRAIDNVIDRYLLLRQARLLHIKISDDELEQNIIDVKLKYNSQTDFDNMIKKKELSLNSFREDIKNKMLIKKYISTFCSKPVDFSDEQLLGIYEENKQNFMKEEQILVAHILIKDKSEEGFKFARKLRDKIKSIKDFEKIAKKFSECPSSKNGGDLGNITRGKMIDDFEKIAFKLKEGETSQPVRTVFGYHLILNKKRFPREYVEFDKIKNSLKKRLIQIEQELHLLYHLRKLRENIPLEIYQENI